MRGDFKVHDARERHFLYMYIRLTPNVEQEYRAFLPLAKLLLTTTEAVGGERSKNWDSWVAVQCCWRLLQMGVSLLENSTTPGRVLFFFHLTRVPSSHVS